MRLAHKVALFGFTASIFAIASGALADEPAVKAPDGAAAVPAAAPAASPAVGEEVDADEDPGFKKVSITANPLSILVGRYSFNVEYMLEKHHGLIVVPSFWSLKSSTGDIEVKYNYVGGELGYHYYTGERGANGFFIGPSAVFMSMSTSASGGGSSASGSATVYGGAIDLGGQHVARNGFTVGGGFGLMYVKASSKIDGSSEPSIKVEGVLPRLLFTMGYSF